MSISISGTSLIFDGTVTISNFSNASAGVATLTLTPSGGLGNLPALVDGQPGLPPTFSIGTVTTLAAGTSATATVTQTSAGGPGSASAYTLGFGIPNGATGAAGTNSTLAGCTDIGGSPAAAAGSIIKVTGVSPTAFNYMPYPWPFVVNPSTITTVSTSGQTTQQLCSMSIASQTFNWIPIVVGYGIVVGTLNTVVQLQATLTAGLRVGDIVGQVSGYAGQATQSLSLNSGFGALVGPSQTYGVVTSGTTATIQVKATQTATTPDSWSINNTTAAFTLIGIPLVT